MRGARAGWAAFLGVCFLTTLLAEGGESYEVQAFLKDEAFRWPRSVAYDAEGRLFVLDGDNHRILVYDGDRLVRQIGQIGQGPSDLFRPLAMTLAGDGNLYVVDQDNYRIQILDREGKRVGGFRIDTISDSIAVSDQGEIFLNAPRHGKLVTVFSKDGRRLRSFGELIPRSRGYPGASDSERFLVPLGRAYLAFGADQDLFVAFQFMPLVQKYSREGKLLWERRLGGEHIRALTDAFFGENGVRQRSVKRMDGVQFAEMVTAIHLSSKGNLLIALADQTLLAVSPSGEILGEKPIRRGRGGVFLSLTQDRGDLVFSSPIGLFRGEYPFDF